MLLRPHLRLLRTRLITATVAIFGVVLIEFMSAVADSPLDIGVFWNHFCGCPADPSDLRILLSLAMDFAVIGGILGFMGGFGPNLRGASRFQLTRPQSRLNAVLTPFFISAVVVAVLPGLAWLLLLSWLRLVHAPALGHLVAIVELIPAASQLGPHPAFPALAAAAHFGRLYLAGISIGLCIYMFLGSSRWLMQSRYTSIKLIAVFNSLCIYLVFLLRYIPRSIFFVPPHDSSFTYVPSIPAIALHFAFAAAWFYGTLWVVRDIEL